MMPFAPWLSAVGAATADMTDFFERFDKEK